VRVNTRSLIVLVLVIVIVLDSPALLRWRRSKLDNEHEHEYDWGDETDPPVSFFHLIESVVHYKGFDLQGI
jgi:hypothetical protein